MNPKLPVISGKGAVKAFRKIGYEVVRQKGSHLRLKDPNDPLHKPITIPDHKELKPGLLRKLIRDANLSLEDFLKLL
jgi:predicted RNA binding protein YcfA (HicA-like mRNA interferase family)